MSTATVQKSKIQPSWTANKVQEEAASALTAQMAATTKILKAANPELLTQVRREWARLKVENFRAQGVKTPFDLVKAWTEYETNLFGSKMQFWGDENKAHVEYEACGCWNALERITDCEVERDSMSEGWSEMTQLLAKEFGFTGQEKIGTEPHEAACTITFTK